MQNAVESLLPRVIGSAGLALSLFFFGSVSGYAQVVKLVGDGRVTVQAEGVILVNMLRELETVIPIEQILLDPAVDGKMVRVELEDVPFREAIEEVLAAAEVNHVVWGEDNGPFRIFAGSAQQTRPVPLSERSVGVDTSGGAGQPDPSGAPPDRSQTPDWTTSPASGEAFPASGEAFLATPPDDERFAATLAILLMGLFSGAWLVGGRRLSPRARSRDSVRIERPR
ncbi:MAG TPA: hypothetical protein VEK15_32835 [Vicinamibacteria bacterium]|nr:hypothetical protein [Vicinamibacteria bacterium]